MEYIFFRETGGVALYWTFININKNKKEYIDILLLCIEALIFGNFWVLVIGELWLTLFCSDSGKELVKLRSFGFLGPPSLDLAYFATCRVS